MLSLTANQQTIPFSGSQVHIVDSEELFEQAIDHLSQFKVLSCDSETTGLDPITDQMLMVQLCGKDLELYLFIITCLSQESLLTLGKLFLGRELVIHNALFDLAFFTCHLGVDPRDHNIKVFDTQLAESMLEAGKVPELRRHTSLANTLLRRLGIKMTKDVRLEFVGHDGVSFTPEQLQYAALDIYYLHKLRATQINELRTWELVEVAQMEFELVKHLTHMKVTGVRVDTERWAQIISEHYGTRDAAMQTVQELAKPYMKQLGLFDEVTFNVDSNAQALAFLRNSVGLDIEDTSEQGLKFANHPLCDAILEYRKQQKIISAFGDIPRMVNKKTGRLHPEFNQALTATGRFSSNNPNVQQIPSRGKAAELRECFIPEEGKKMICADYSQIELRILAELSQEPALLYAYNNGIDVHTQTAATALGLTVDDVTPEQRKVAKILSFASVYGGGPMAIGRGLIKTISAHEAQEILLETFGVVATEDEAYFTLAKEFLNSYMERLPKAQEFLELAGKTAVRERFSATPMGRKRFYTELDQKVGKIPAEDFKQLVRSVERRGKNHQVQGCSADITKVAIVELSKFAYLHPEYGCSILLTVHDEIVTEVFAEKAEEFVKIQNDIMVAAGELFITTIPVAVDCHIADYWAKEG